MPFEIVRNDITRMQADAIVNTASPKLFIGWGVDSGLHKKAGPGLLKARREIGYIAPGEAAVTDAFGLDARYVIHTVGPVWHGGAQGEEQCLASCYRNSLRIALDMGCESIAFPLISAGNHGFPKPAAMKIAIREISGFLLDNDMQVYLVVFSSDAYKLSERFYPAVASYIDDNYILGKTFDEYGVSDKCSVRELELRQYSRALEADYTIPYTMPLCCDTAATVSELQALLNETDAGFSETLLMLIDRTGRKDSEIYRRANVDRKLFSKIRNNPDYRPSKATALSFAIALELDLDETRDFISRAGYALTHSSKQDIIVEYFIINRMYNIHELNVVLFENDQQPLGV